MNATPPLTEPKAAHIQSFYTQEVQVPEWEHVAAAEHGIREKKTGATSRSFMATVRDAQTGIAARFDRLMPPHHTYLRLSRRTFLFLLGAIIALIALIIGIAVGLTRRSGQPSDLPLPSNTNTFTGDLTYYDPGLGACGETDTSTDAIVAVSHILFDAAGSSSSTGGNSNNNPLCGKMLRAQRYDADVGAMRSVDLKVVDRCTGCKVDDLDTTEGMFMQMADVARGRVDVTWAWL